MSYTIHSLSDEILHAGIDIGSTTTKIILIDKGTNTIVFSRYTRHNACQVESVCRLLNELADYFPRTQIKIAICGSGGKEIATRLGVPFIQEVVANSLAVRTLYPEARTAIELGGQDAKIIFFSKDTQSAKLKVSDMRMNGSCAGGTGAFIDEIAALLKTPVEEFESLASRGTTIYDISGRCGVYAKTDIQPLLNQGVKKEDIALSALHALVKQTIGGLSQGLEIKAPVVFEGGPLTFNPSLIRVFGERLELDENDVIRPERPETIVALGAAISLSETFGDSARPLLITDALRILENHDPQSISSTTEPPLAFFSSEGEFESFKARHLSLLPSPIKYSKGSTLTAYLGIDSGSTTTKFALLDENENLVDSFYAPNEGEPLTVIKTALFELRDRYQKKGLDLRIAGVGTTGYGELLFHKALHADYHVVETVAHAEATSKYVPDVSFILDIGGQDMKAITLNKGIITDITVNEACSSGCGSFLENFAASLAIPVDKIADAAFRAQNPAILGSRCTVFMNSSIVTEQKNGKNADDIMAGLCRSIIENVFTKVIRISNLNELGSTIVVQGGTFKNDAVLRALEQYTGKEVVRAPYPEIMGAIGTALLTKKKMESSESKFSSTFIGLDSIEAFSFSQESGVICPFCANHCNRSVVRFHDSTTWVTGNRCERGEVLGDPADNRVKERIREINTDLASVPNLFKLRQELLFTSYPIRELCPTRATTIGLPRVLEFWNSMPFWSTFFRSLGFTIVMSKQSTRELYEQGIPSVSSDTVCFPAKLVHGHIKDLADAKVDRIFMPIITTMESENTEKTSESVCAIVKGYPMVVKSSDDPEKRWNIAFDTPLFHWYTKTDRDNQLSHYMLETFGVDEKTTRKAIELGDEALNTFQETLQAKGEQVLKEVEKSKGFAVVLASRPYQNDSLVNHDLPELFTSRGIPVLSVDSVPGIYEVDLSKSRLDIVNNFHTRMLSSAYIAARNPHLEYAQIVSFGCGHDALLSDEIIRIMGESSGKTPLVLKLDESDIQGPLHLRVESFVETLKARRTEAFSHKEMADPYPVKFTKTDRKDKIILVPNVSRAFCKIMSAAMSKQGVRAEPLPLGGSEAIRLGKAYVHNDICFPAQITIGEALAALESGLYDDRQVAIGTGKLIGDCRLTHYAALLRKALDDAGYGHVPIITNDDVDKNNLHPGYTMSIATMCRIAFALPMIDILEELLHKIRPYELVPGKTDLVFNQSIDGLAAGIQSKGVRGGLKAFKQAIRAMNEISYDRSSLKTPVLVIGEYLLNFHPGANYNIEEYLERNNIEVIEPRMTDVYRKGYFYRVAQIKEFGVKKPFVEKTWLSVADSLFEVAHSAADRIAIAHPLYEPVTRMPELVKVSDPIMHHSFDSGEGFLLPAEILHQAERGVRSFIILQPFGCLPNHICGRGLSKRIKECYPDAQILPLDYDPDTSFANIENRLQMLIMSAHNTKVPEVAPTPAVMNAEVAYVYDEAAFESGFEQASEEVSESKVPSSAA